MKGQVVTMGTEMVVTVSNSIEEFKKVVAEKKSQGFELDKLELHLSCKHVVYLSAEEAIKLMANSTTDYPCPICEGN